MYFLKKKTSNHPKIPSFKTKSKKNLNHYKTKRSFASLKISRIKYIKKYIYKALVNFVIYHLIFASYV